MADFAAQDFGSPDFNIDLISQQIKSTVFINTEMKSQVRQRSGIKNTVKTNSEMRNKVVIL